MLMKLSVFKYPYDQLFYGDYFTADLLNFHETSSRDDPPRKSTYHLLSRLELVVTVSANRDYFTSKGLLFHLKLCKRIIGSENQE